MSLISSSFIAPPPPALCCLTFPQQLIEIHDSLMSGIHQRFPVHAGSSGTDIFQYHAQIHPRYHTDFLRILRVLQQSRTAVAGRAKEQIAENQDTVPEWLSGLVHVYEQTAVSVRQSAK